MENSEAIVAPATAAWAMKKLWKAVYWLSNGKAGAKKEAQQEIDRVKEEALEEIDQVRRYYTSIRRHITSGAYNPLKNSVHTYYNCDFKQHELGKFYQEIIDSANNGATDSDNANNCKNLEDPARRLDASMAELEKLTP